MSTMPDLAHLREWIGREWPPATSPRKGSCATDTDLDWANDDVRRNPSSAAAHLGRGIEQVLHRLPTVPRGAWRARRVG